METVLETLRKNVDLARGLVREAAGRIPERRGCPCSTEPGRSVRVTRLIHSRSSWRIPVATKEYGNLVDLLHASVEDYATNPIFGVKQDDGIWDWNVLTNSLLAFNLADAGGPITCDATSVTSKATLL